MGHYLFYVVDVPGVEFRNKLASEDRATARDIAVYEEPDGYWGGRLPRTKESLCVELSGVVTVICYPTKYTHLLIYPDITAGVLSWEQALRSLCPSEQTARIDESILNQWEQIAGEFWYRDPAKSEEFFEWIKLQDRESWEYL